MERLEKIGLALKALDADAVLITHADNRLYASGFQSSAGMVFVTAQADAYYLTDSRYLEAAQKQLLAQNFQIADTTTGYEPTINQLIAKHGVKRLAVENLHLTLAEYQNFKQALQAELVFADGAIDQLRAYLTEQDRDQLADAQRRAEKALEQTLSAFKIGMTEKELTAELIYRMYQSGAEELSFKPEIISGANASMPHGNPSDKPIVAGDVLLMDFGLVRNGYWSDMSRTFAVGYATDELQQVYDTVLEAQKRAIAFHAIGKTGIEVDAVARNYILQSGIEGCYQHALGHAIGLMGAAPLCLANPRSKTVFEAGNTITFEPGIYQPGKLGCRIEDIVWLGADGSKVNLTHFPKEELIVLK